HIEEHLEHIANMLPNKKAKLAFTSFFQAYREEVMEHFNYEEVNVYPYIESLQQNSDDRSYNIDTFLNSHGNLQETLNDLTQIIFKYLPQNDASDDAIDVIFDILQFSQDLYKHSLIEERVLAPYVKLLEHARV
ncbi:MAG: hemerythrin domain-containing protein, partial [Muribaculaceae bacterium]|nr:hemerythrin domain-containing protein [Muribaculaceae bacterium]